MYVLFRPFLFSLSFFTLALDALSPGALSPSYHTTPPSLSLLALSLPRTTPHLPPHLCRAGDAAAGEEGDQGGGPSDGAKGARHPAGACPHRQLRRQVPVAHDHPARDRRHVCVCGAPGPSPSHRPSRPSCCLSSLPHSASSSTLLSPAPVSLPRRHWLSRRSKSWTASAATRSSPSSPRCPFMPLPWQPAFVPGPVPALTFYFDATAVSPPRRPLCQDLSCELGKEVYLWYREGKGRQCICKIDVKDKPGKVREQNAHAKETKTPTFILPLCCTFSSPPGLWSPRFSDVSPCPHECRSAKRACKTSKKRRKRRASN